MRLTKNFMVDDDTALIYGIQLIPGLESSTPFIGSDRLVIVSSIVRPGALPLPLPRPRLSASLQGYSTIKLDFPNIFHLIVSR